MAGRYDADPFAQEDKEVNPFSNAGRAPPAANSRLKPLPHEPTDFYDRDASVDIPLDSAADLKSKERELKAKEAELNRREQEMSAPVVDGNNEVTGHIISTTIGGKNGEPKQTVSYMAERVVGTGSFGVVFQAKCLETGETVAIKKVLQDRRYKNRELQLMRTMNHPNVVGLKHCFFSTTSSNELFLNLVMEYVPETMYRVLKHYSNANQQMPLIYVKLYTYQIFRGLAYMHAVPGVCHRDLKPQNVLVDPLTHQVKICDFGSAKMLVKGEANISYICSRFYRVLELIFGATEYTTSIDIWSAGCVLAELLLGQVNTSIVSWRECCWAACGDY